MATQESSVHENDFQNVPRVDDTNDHEPFEGRTPLPVLPLVSVLLIQLAEPITATVIYPFINQFVRETGITGGDEVKTGYYAGIIESVFFFTESVTVVQWGYLSDRYGRRPILLCAPLGLTFAMLIFGSSSTFWPLVFARSMQGVFNGNIGVTKSVMAEVTDSTNRADAFGLIPVTWSTGVTTGPIIGGLLSNAATRWPDTLGRIGYIKSHPYFLPCFIAAVFTFSTFIIVCFALKETLPSLVLKERLQKEKKFASEHTLATDASPLIDHGSEFEYGTSSHPSTSRAETIINTPDSSCKSDSPSWNVIFERPILMTLLNHMYLTFMDMCHAALLPLMYSTPVEFGGLGLDPFRIGFLLGTFGFLNSILQVNILGPVVRKYGSRSVFRVAFACYLGMFGMYPVLHFFAHRAGGADIVVYLCIVIQLCFQTMTYMAYGSLSVLLLECIPEGGPMGTINGVAQMLGSGMRSFAPTFASSLFSISLQRNLAGGNMVYYILITMTLIGTRMNTLLPIIKRKAKARSPGHTPNPSSG